MKKAIDVRQPNLRLRKTCSAPAEVVYDVLSDLRTHLDWGGTQQWRNFRLLTLAAPEDAATVGTVFSSTGAIPMSGRRWQDRSTVTVATRPTTFEFVTEARARDVRRETAARYVHRYEIAPLGNRSSVTYSFTEERVSKPMLRFTMPVMRVMSWWMAGLMLAKGFGNLMAAAEARQQATNVHNAGARVAT